MKFPAQYRLIQFPEIVVEFYAPRSGKVIEGGTYYTKGRIGNHWYDCDDETMWERLGDPPPTFHPHPVHSRFLKVVLFENGVEKTMNIEVRYLGESNAENGCLLDHIVMPTIKERLNVVE